MDKRIEEAIKLAYEEGYVDGHDQGMTCGHSQAPRCRRSVELNEGWAYSCTRVIMKKIKEEADGHPA